MRGSALVPLATLALTSTGALAQTVQIGVKSSGKCLDACTTYPEQWNCHSSPSKQQYWTIIDHQGTVLFQNGNSKSCLGRPESDTNGAKVTIRKCDTNDWNVRWWTKSRELSTSTYIGYYSPNGKFYCLDNNWQKIDAFRLQVWECDPWSNGTPDSQAFTFQKPIWDNIDVYPSCNSNPAPLPPLPPKRRAGSFKESGIQFPLRTESRWIVDDEGYRVKLACVNWPGHMELQISEGLHVQSARAIAKQIAKLGLNCVRLTWAVKPIVDFANLGGLAPTVSSIAKSVASTGKFAGLPGLVNRIKETSIPDIDGLQPMLVFDRVIKALGQEGVMVVLDNHISRPTWCCGEDDGNGWFDRGDFNTTEWKQALGFLAARYAKTKHVIGFSLRNELRTSSNVAEWAKHMPEAGERIHKNNPNALVIMSGMSYDTDLQFAVSLLDSGALSRLDGQLVLEAHAYSWSFRADYGTPAGCQSGRNVWQKQWGFFLSQGQTYTIPIFVSEFGSGTYDGFVECMTGYLANTDMGFAWWTIGGSYYARDNRSPFEGETFGLLNDDFSGVQPSHRETVAVLKELAEFQT